MGNPSPEFGSPAWRRQIIPLIEGLKALVCLKCLKGREARLLGILCVMNTVSLVYGDLGRNFKYLFSASSKKQRNVYKHLVSSVRAGRVAQLVRALHEQECGPGYNHWNKGKCGRRETIPPSCPLTFTCMLWPPYVSTHTHTHTLTYKQVRQFKIPATIGNKSSEWQYFYRNRTNGSPCHWL